MNFYIDIDGGLLGKSPETRKCVLANYAAEFLQFSLQNFDCFWLTTHCKGSVDTVLRYLMPFADEEFMALAQQIQPTYFKTFKVEALAGDFLWIDDQPTAYELQYLDENDWLNRWIQVNTRKDINELGSTIRFLQRYV